jgi:hypothetical protein
MKTNTQDNLEMVKKKLITEINQNFTAKQYNLIVACATAALDILYEEALKVIDEDCNENDNSLSDLAKFIEKV